MDQNKNRSKDFPGNTLLKMAIAISISSLSICLALIPYFMSVTDKVVVPKSYTLSLGILHLPGLTDGVLRWSRWTLGEGLAPPAFDIGRYSSQVNDRC